MDPIPIGNKLAPKFIYGEGPVSEEWLSDSDMWGVQVIVLYYQPLSSSSCGGPYWPISKLFTFSRNMLNFVLCIYISV